MRWFMPGVVLTVIASSSACKSDAPTQNRAASDRCAQESETFEQVTVLQVTSGTQPTYSWTFGPAQALTVEAIDADQKWSVIPVTTAGIQPPVEHRSHDGSSGYATLPGSVLQLTTGREYIGVAVSKSGTHAACVVFVP